MEVVLKLPPWLEAAAPPSEDGGGPALMQHTGGRTGGPVVLLVMAVDCGASAAPGREDPVMGGTSRLVGNG